MVQYSDEDILKIFNSYREKIKDELNLPKPEFGLETLVCKMILEVRKIKNIKGNPEYFDVIQFTDGSLLFSEMRGNGEFTNHYCYFYDSKKVFFTDELFST